jgi:hypothetical protein
VNTKNVQYGTCPVCSGTGRMPCPDHLRKYAESNGWYGYKPEDDCVDCTNCGAQYMFGKASGKVRLRDDGTPCEHEYTSSKGSWRCTTNYHCKHCGDTYMIDSGD